MEFVCFVVIGNKDEKLCTINWKGLETSDSGVF
jgi:hypothetical protein